MGGFHLRSYPDSILVTSHGVFPRSKDFGIASVSEDSLGVWAYQVELPHVWKPVGLGRSSRHHVGGRDFDIRGTVSPGHYSGASGSLPAPGTIQVKGRLIWIPSYNTTAVGFHQSRNQKIL